MDELISHLRNTYSTEAAARVQTEQYLTRHSTDPGLLLALLKICSSHPELLLQQAAAVVLKNLVNQIDPAVVPADRVQKLQSVIIESLLTCDERVRKLIFPVFGDLVVVYWPQSWTGLSDHLLSQFVGGWSSGDINSLLHVFGCLRTMLRVNRFASRAFHEALEQLLHALLAESIPILCATRPGMLPAVEAAYTKILLRTVEALPQALISQSARFVEQMQWIALVLTSQLDVVRSSGSADTTDASEPSSSADPDSQDLRLRWKTARYALDVFRSVLRLRQEPSLPSAVRTALLHCYAEVFESIVCLTEHVAVQAANRPSNVFLDEHPVGRCENRFAISSLCAFSEHVEHAAEYSLLRPALPRIMTQCALPLLRLTHAEVEEADTDMIQWVNDTHRDLCAGLSDDADTDWSGPATPRASSLLLLRVLATDRSSDAVETVYQLLEQTLSQWMSDDVQALLQRSSAAEALWPHIADRNAALLAGAVVFPACLTNGPAVHAVEASETAWADQLHALLRSHMAVGCFSASANPEVLGVHSPEELLALRRQSDQTGGALDATPALVLLRARSVLCVGRTLAHWAAAPQNLYMFLMQVLVQALLDDTEAVRAQSLVVFREVLLEGPEREEMAEEASALLTFLAEELGKVRATIHTLIDLTQHRPVALCRPCCTRRVDACSMLVDSLLTDC